MTKELTIYGAVPARQSAYDGELDFPGSHRVEIRFDEGHYRVSVARSYLAGLTPNKQIKGGLINVRA